MLDSILYISKFSLFIALIYFVLIVFVSILYSSFGGLYFSFILNASALFFLNYILLYNFFLFKNTNQFFILDFCNWFSILHINIKFSLYIDTLALAFAALTTNIGFFVILYTFSYFRGEPNINKLINLLLLFIISMLLLIFSKNLIVFFLGWELIGFTSFLLINFWTLKISTLKSSLKAFFFNRWSDSFFLLFIITNFFLTNNLEIETLNYSYLVYFINDKIDLWTFVKDYDFNIDESFINTHKDYIHSLNKEDFTPSFPLNIILIFIILSSGIKSAQLIGHLWLPDSMEAPVPASALIHSATLISAGIYLILRFNLLISSTNSIYLLIYFWGCITSIYGGCIAAGQMDLKRILAYSTISHCGNMIVLASLGLLDYTIIYLYTHGFFKAISFLCVGNIIRFYKNIQDLRKMGMNATYQVSDCLLITVSLLNLGGLPLSFGFYIKHFMFTIINENNLNFISLGFSCLILTTLTGFVYSFKIIYNTMFDSKKGNLNFYFKFENLNLINKNNYIYYMSNSYITFFIIIFSLINSYIILFQLLNSFFFDNFNENKLQAIYLHKSYILNNNYSLLKFNSIFLLNLLILLLDYWIASMWRGLITRSNGKYYIYLWLIPFMHLIDLINY